MADWNGNTYVIVDKKLWKKRNNGFQEVIREFQREIRKNHKITFEAFLVGSAKRRLVTKNNNNNGYDFDYRLILHKGSNCETEKLQVIFYNAINKAIKAKAPQYETLEKNSRAFTIKLLKKDRKAIDHSFDFVITRENKRPNGEIYDILYYDEVTKKNHWEAKTETEKYKEKDKYIVKEKQSWHLLEEEYLKLKNSNGDRHKKSFSLYYEAINNVYAYLKLKEKQAGIK